MRRSLAHGSGFLEIDHRESPGLTPADVAHVPGAIPVGKGEHFECDVQHCTHCQRAVVLHPQRTRPRGYCPKCDHYICDHCESIRSRSGACVPMAKTEDTFTGRGVDPPAHPILLTDHQE